MYRKILVRSLFAFLPYIVSAFCFRSKIPSNIEFWGILVSTFIAFMSTEYFKCHNIRMYHRINGLALAMYAFYMMFMLSYPFFLLSTTTYAFIYMLVLTIQGYFILYCNDQSRVIK